MWTGWMINQGLERQERTQLAGVWVWTRWQRFENARRKKEMRVFLNSTQTNYLPVMIFWREEDKGECFGLKTEEDAQEFFRITFLKWLTVSHGLIMEECSKGGWICHWQNGTTRDQADKGCVIAESVLQLKHHPRCTKKMAMKIIDS